MDIYEYLKKDHQKVAKLFKQFESEKRPQYMMEIFDYIADELVIHAKAEQETFYKTLEHFPDTHELVQHGKEEHLKIVDHIIALTKATKATDAWKKKVLELKKIVEHHVSDEEGPIFRKAKKVLSEEQALVIKERMHDMKDKLKMVAEATMIEA